MAEPLFIPVSFKSETSSFDEIPYDGGSLIIYGENGVGKSLLLEGIASSLQGKVVGRAEAGWGMPEEESKLGLVARLNDVLTNENVRFYLRQPQGVYPYDMFDELLEAIDKSRTNALKDLDDPHHAELNKLMDEFMSLGHVFLAPLVQSGSPGWRLHAAVRVTRKASTNSQRRALEAALNQDHDVWPLDWSEEAEINTYIYNGLRPHLF